MWPSAVCLTPKGASEGDDVPTLYSRTLTCVRSPKPPCQKFGHSQVAMLGGSSGHTQGLWSLAGLRSLLTTALTASGLSPAPGCGDPSRPEPPQPGPRVSRSRQQHSSRGPLRPLTAAPVSVRRGSLKALTFGGKPLYRNSDLNVAETGKGVKDDAGEIC